jgi:hypothetical protein
LFVTRVVAALSIPWRYAEEGASISINALEPTASSFGFAYASGGGSPLAFGHS